MHTVKVAILGPVRVGKTALIRCLYELYEPHAPYETTVGYDINTIVLSKTRFCLWECGGAHRFGALGQGCLSLADILVMVHSNAPDDRPDSALVRDLYQVNPQTRIIHVIIDNHPADLDCPQPVVVWVDPATGQGLADFKTLLLAAAHAPECGHETI
jgi:signal recognition particle receptor subunit beta